MLEIHPEAKHSIVEDFSGTVNKKRSDRFPQSWSQSGYSSRGQAMFQQSGGQPANQRYH